MAGAARAAWMSTAEQEHIRELMRASRSLLDAAESDPGLAFGTRMAAAGAAAALQKVAQDFGRLAQEWREVRSCEERLERRLDVLERQLAGLARVVEEELPAAV